MLHKSLVPTEATANSLQASGLGSRRVDLIAGSLDRRGRRSTMSDKISRI